MQGHAVHHAGHRELRNACLEELAREVALDERLGLLQITVGLVRVGEVGRGHDHILHPVGVAAQHGRRGGAGSHVGLHLDLFVVDHRQVALQEEVELAAQILVLAAPLLLTGGHLLGPALQLQPAPGVDLDRLVEDLERIFGVALQVSHRSGEIGSGRRQRLSVGRHHALVAGSVGRHGPLAHRRATDNQGRTLGLGQCGLQRGTQGVDVMSVRRLDTPAPGTVFHGDVLRIHLIDAGRELDVVGVVIHDQVVQTQVAGDAAHALRNLLLDGTVRNVGIGLVSHPLAETGHQETLGDCGAQRHGVSLSQRTRRILDTAQHVHLGMSRRDAAPLPQVLQILDGEISGERQCGIEHRRHVSRIQEEAVAERMVHAGGVVVQKLGIEQVDEVGTAHGTARVT